MNNNYSITIKKESYLDNCGIYAISEINESWIAVLARDDKQMVVLIDRKRKRVVKYIRDNIFEN